MTSRGPLPWLRQRPEIPLATAVFVIALAIWQASVSYLGISAILLPSPGKVLYALVTLFTSGQIVPHLLVTGTEIIGGFAIGGSIGLVLGCLLGRYALLEKALYPYIVAFQAVPKVALAPIVVIWFGFDMPSKLAMAAMIAFFPVIANTVVGLATLPAEHVEMMSSFTASRSQIFWHARLIHAAPYVFAGLDIAIVLSIIGAIVGEFVGSQAGLGFLILQRQYSMDVAGVFAILIVLSAIGMLLHGLMRWLQRRVVFWMDGKNDQIVVS
jgi:NitT/TauT family transport system permease protein